jgi:hypothetical protein
MSSSTATTSTKAKSDSSKTKETGNKLNKSSSKPNNVKRYLGLGAGLVALLALIAFGVHFGRERLFMSTSAEKTVGPLGQSVKQGPSNAPPATMNMNHVSESIKKSGSFNILQIITKPENRPLVIGASIATFLVIAGVITAIVYSSMHTIQVSDSENPAKSGGTIIDPGKGSTDVPAVKPPINIGLAVGLGVLGFVVLLGTVGGLVWAVVSKKFDDCGPARTIGPVKSSEEPLKTKTKVSEDPDKSEPGDFPKLPYADPNQLNHAKALERACSIAPVVLKALGKFEKTGKYDDLKASIKAVNMSYLEKDKKKISDYLRKVSGVQ